MNKDIVELEDGFYYWDEVGIECGPFPSIEIAQTAFEAYCKWLREDHHTELRKMRDYYD